MLTGEGFDVGSSLDGFGTDCRPCRQQHPLSGQGLLLDMVLGIVGAVVGGALFTAIGATGVTGFNLYSILFAIVGAIVVLWAYHTFSGRSL